MILKQLGILSWEEMDENLVLASLLTGDPLLLIGNHGCAKAHLATRIAEALGKRFPVYNAPKAMFAEEKSLSKRLLHGGTNPCGSWIAAGSLRLCS